MMRFEAIGVLLLAGVCIALVSWLWWSLIRGRRRVPERLGAPFLIDEKDIEKLEPGCAIPVNGDPRNITKADLRAFLRQHMPREAFDWPVSGAVPFDWARDLHTPDWSRRRV